MKAFISMVVSIMGIFLFLLAVFGSSFGLEIVGVKGAVLGAVGIIIALYGVDMIERTWFGEDGNG